MRIYQSEEKKFEAIFLLNAPVDKLYQQEIIGVRVSQCLTKLGVKNLAELRDKILKSRWEEKEMKNLRIFGRKSVKEINQLFSQIDITLPDNW